MSSTYPGGVTVETVETVAHELPLSESFPTSYGETITDHLFVRVRGDGKVGYGEGSALRNFTGETAATMASVATDHLHDAIVGKSIDNALSELASLRDHIPDHPGACVGVELALLDLKSKHAGLPLRDLLGRPRRASIPTVRALGAVVPDMAAERIASGLADGYARFKVKADGNPAADAARVNAVTAVLSDHDPDAVSVRDDANTGWGTAERARRAVERFDHTEYIEYIEQPVACGATDDLRELRRTTGLPVFADESVHGLTAVRSLTASPRAVSGICAKLAKTGSVREFATIGEVAGDTSLPVTPISAFDTSLGAAAVLHLASVAPQLSAAAEIIPDMVAEDRRSIHSRRLLRWRSRTARVSGSLSTTRCSTDLYSFRRRVRRA